MDEHPIPPTTHRWSNSWRQPEARRILVNAEEAVICRADFVWLAEYSYTRPTGIYAGKMWKAKNDAGWWLYWWDRGDREGTAVLRFRPLTVVESPYWLEHFGEQTDMVESLPF